jgi:hypothetical protein
MAAASTYVYARGEGERGGGRDGDGDGAAWNTNVEEKFGTFAGGEGRTGAGGGSSRRDVGGRDDHGALACLQLALSVIQ